MLKIYFKKLKPEAIIPKKGMDGAVGYDILNMVHQTLKPGERRTIMTGIAGRALLDVESDFDFWAEFKGCSGNSHKHGLEILGGVIDPNYTGEWGVICLNTGDHEIVFGRGDKLAQAVFVPHYKNDEVFEVEDLGETVRGEKGFGSTGVAGETK